MLWHFRFFLLRQIIFSKLSGKYARMEVSRLVSEISSSLNLVSSFKFKLVKGLLEQSRVFKFGHFLMFSSVSWLSRQVIDSKLKQLTTSKLVILLVGQYNLLSSVNFSNFKEPVKFLLPTTSSGISFFTFSSKNFWACI